MSSTIKDIVRLHGLVAEAAKLANHMAEEDSLELGELTYHIEGLSYLLATAECITRSYAPGEAAGILASISLGQQQAQATTSNASTDNDACEPCYVVLNERKGVAL